MKTCAECNGKGGRYIPSKDIHGDFEWDWETCWTCQGTGKYEGKEK